jgi:hypothetical protein
MKNSSALFFLFLWAYSANCQSFVPATVTLRDGAVKEGKAALNFREGTPQRVRFVGADGQEKTYAPLDLKGFELRNNDGRVVRFASHIVQVNQSDHSDLSDLEVGPEIRMETDTFFLQSLLESEFGLLKLERKSRTHFFIEKDSVYELVRKRYYRDVNTQQTVLYNNRYQSQLLKLTLAAFPTLTQRIQKLTYGQSQFLKLLEDLNGLSNAPIRYRWQAEKAKAGFSVLVGATHTTFLNSLSKTSSRPKSVEPSGYSAPIQYTLGVGVSLPISGTGKRLSFYNDLTLRRLKAESPDETEFVQDDGSVALTPVQVYNIAHLRLHSGLRWNLLKRAGPNVFLQGCLVNSYAFFSDNTRINTNVAIPIREEVWAGEVKEYEFGLSAGLGFSWKRLSLLMRYDRGDGFSPRASFQTPTRTTTLLLGWRL